MAVRSCRVTTQDLDGVSHTVELTAATLYEAVAQGLAAIRGNEWVGGIAQGLNVVKVSVADVRVEHTAPSMLSFSEISFFSPVNPLLVGERDVKSRQIETS